MQSTVIRVTTCVVASLLVAAGAIQFYARGRHAVQAAPKVTRIPIPVANRATPACTGTTDSDIAYCEFSSLTAATQPWTGPKSAPPIWTEWLDKCNLNVGPCASGETQVSESNPCPPIPVASEQLVAHHPDRAVISDQLALGAATQISQRNEQTHLKPHHGPQPLTPINELSSVLFSPELCPAIEGITSNGQAMAAITAANQQNLQGPDRDISALANFPSMGMNATAIKLIWEIVYNGDPVYGAHVYYPQGDSGQAGAVLPIKNPFLWSTFYSINTDESAPCTAGLPQQPFPKPDVPANASTLPINCFYHIALDPSNAAVQKVLDNNQTNLIPSHLPPGNEPPFVILVGAHVMVFNPSHKLWQWMTFYWTPQVNTKGWKDPWQHYQMLTTAAPGEGLPLPAGHTDIANPYLEGSIDGMSSNCLSCHSLAVYSPAIKKPEDQVGCAAAIVDHDVTSNPAGEYPKTEQDAIAAGYFTGGIRTHFIWSLTTNPAMYTGATGTSKCAGAATNIKVRH